MNTYERVLRLNGFGMCTNEAPVGTNNSVHKRCIFKYIRIHIFISTRRIILKRIAATYHVENSFMIYDFGGLSCSSSLKVH